MASLFDHVEDDDQDLASDDFDFRPHGSTVGESGSEDVLYNEINEEDIRRIAAALAPQMSELEDFLKGISASDDYVSSTMELSETTNRSMRDENDDLDDELKMLAMSEQALREELEFAQDMKDMLTRTLDDGDHKTKANEEPFAPSEKPLLPEPQSRISEDPPEIAKPPKTYSLQDHADYLKLRAEKMGGWYYCDMSRFVQTDLESEYNKDLVKDYCLPIPFRKLKRLYCGLVYHQITPVKSQQVLSTPARGLASPAPSIAVDSSMPRTPIRTPGNAAMPATPKTPANVPAPPPLPQEEPLPVRTVAIRIRPDVLVGAVMEAIHHAFEVMPSNCTSHVLKRQGGHLRAAVYMPDKPLAYVADCQLCTQKNDELERRLIVRFYHIQDDPDAMQELGQVLHQMKAVTKSSDAAISSQTAGESENDINIANHHMKESCSLIQRLLATQQLGGPSQMDLKQQASWLGLRDTSFSTMQEMQRVVRSHLVSNFNPCPSVREENKKSTPTIRRLTLPSLSPKDWALMEVSWALTTSIFDELDTRDCSYHTLASLSFGQFPALQTLDVHFCSQLRRVSREFMINHLLKSAKDLEAYAKGAEYNCAICISLLEPMLVHYGIPPLGLPNTSKSLQDYPLDYTLPQVACPPWGSLVSQALNHVQSKTPTNEIDATFAVKMVYDAFVRQDDEEQSARLGRKNAQIMDRLATLQRHQRALVQNIRDAHVYSEKAAQEAAAFLKNAQKAFNAGQAGFPRALQPEVPLLSFRISQGASTSGTCFISASQILFVTTFIPLVGGSRSMLFDLLQIDFQVDESVTATLLNPFPNTMNVVITSSKEVAFRFRPTVSPTRLFKFLKVIQSFANEEQPSEFSQVVDNLNVVKEDEDGKGRLAEALSDDHFSV